MRVHNVHEPKVLLRIAFFHTVHHRNGFLHLLMLLLELFQRLFLNFATVVLVLIHFVLLKYIIDLNFAYHLSVTFLIWKLPYHYCQCRYAFYLYTNSIEMYKIAV
ncbi:unnamed protein product [Brugia timori]|uniref:Uncharacterized protein n=1 Tax=Brugia timori TaxID=42155 RepID=A0A3P7WKB5_9BILA|nr:unnamed protein product [Brugia timori]